MRYSEEQYKQKYDLLSAKLQEFIGSENVDGGLADIARDFNLNPDKRRNLAGEVAYVLIGLEPKEKIIENIKQYVEIDEITAQKIKTELDEYVFTPADDLNLPALPEEREVTIEPIRTGNPVLDGQLKVPVVRTAQTISTQPTQAVRSAPSILDTRLGTSINLPHEEMQVGAKPEAKYSGKDPYREPTE